MQEGTHESTKTGGMCVCIFLTSIIMGTLAALSMKITMYTDRYPRQRISCNIIYSLFVAIDMESDRHLDFFNNRRTFTLTNNIIIFQDVS